MAALTALSRAVSGTSTGVGLLCVPIGVVATAAIGFAVAGVLIGEVGRALEEGLEERLEAGDGGCDDADVAFDVSPDCEVGAVEEEVSRYAVCGDIVEFDDGCGGGTESCVLIGCLDLFERCDEMNRGFGRRSRRGNVKVGGDLQDSKRHDSEEGKLDSCIDLNVPEHRHRKNSKNNIRRDSEC